MIVGLVGTGLVVAGIVFVVGVAATARWDRYAAKLRAKGQPVTFDEILARQSPIPDGETGASVIEGLADRLETLRTTEVDPRVLVFARRSSETAFFSGIPRDSVDPSGAFIEPFVDVVSRLADLRELPSGRVACPPVGDWLNFDFTYMGRFRVALKLYRLKTILDLIGDDTSAAVADVHVLISLSAMLDEQPTVIARMVQVAVDALTVRSLEDTLRVGTLDDDTLAQFADVVDQRRAASTLTWGFWGERAFFVDLCDRFADATFSPKQFNSIAGGSVPPLLPDALIRANQIRGTQLLTRYVNAGDDPAALLSAAASLDTEIQTLPATQVISKIMLPSLSRAVTLHLRATAQLACARVALAAERYRLATGALPDSMDVLVPAYLDEIPTDPFDGKPMKFAATAEGIVIYSVNEDGNDDGGNVAQRQKRPYYFDIGFRLNNPSHRGLLLIDNPLPVDDD